MSRARAVICSVSLLVLLGQGMPAWAARKTQKAEEIVWPAPPQTPRIKFLGLLRNQDDLRAIAGKRAGEWLGEFLLGAKQVPNSLQQPMGLALSRDGKRLYVSDYAKPAVFVFNFSSKRVASLGGTGTCCQTPLGIAVDGKDNVYVVDSTPKTIRVFDATGAPVRTITYEGFERPTGIAIDDARNRLYVADSAKNDSDQHVIQVFDLTGHHVKTLGKPGNAEGEFYFPSYLAVDGQGNLYVADTLNGRVQVFNADGGYVKTVGGRGDAFGMFDKPKGIGLDSFGNVYVVDSSWSNVQIFNQKGQVLLYFGGRGRAPGLLFNPTGIVLDSQNHIYVADAFNGRVAMYQLVNTKAEDSVIALPPQRADNSEPSKPEATSPSPAAAM